MDATLIITIQAVYYYITAIWPLVHVKSFMTVTGPKVEIWLVKTVSVLIIAIANALVVSLYFNEAESATVMVLSVSSCICLLLVDIFYSIKGTISKIYLLDAAVELLILIAWSLILLH